MATFFLFLLFNVIGCSTTQHSIIQNHHLKQISDDFWTYSIKSAPTWATYIGEHQYDNLLPDISKNGLRQRSQSSGLLAEKLKEIDITTLDAKEKLMYDALNYQFDTIKLAQHCKTELWVVDQLNGPQVWMAELPNHHAIRSTKDALNLASRYHNFEGYMNDHINNLKMGLIQGYTSPKKNVQMVINQLDRQLNVPVIESPFVDLKIDSSFSSASKESITKEIAFAAENKIYPALAKYSKFLKTNVLPHARAASGVSNLPNGKTCYQALIKTHTGLDISPQRIHALGIAEVKRIKDGMEKLIQKEHPHISTASYIQQLRNSKSQFVTTKQALINHNEALLEKAQSKLGKMFSNFPKTPIAIKSIEAFREQEAPAAYYYEATGDPRSKAYYYLNTFEPKSRPLYNMAALAFHEAVPGHHFQIALANENKGLPEFQRKMGQTAFIEGWALYAESLAMELGLYETLEEKVGAYNYELWRALRLVVDTGIHAFGWSREQAISYLAKETALPEGEVENEIDRYIIWPGQALAYKIGQLTISEMRRDAKDALKEKFSLKAFHDELLSYGALPLSTIKQNMQAWVAALQVN